MHLHFVYFCKETDGDPAERMKSFFFLFQTELQSSSGLTSNLQGKYLNVMTSVGCRLHPDTDSKCVPSKYLKNVLLEINNVAQGLEKFSILVKLAQVSEGLDNTYIKANKKIL